MSFRYPHRLNETLRDFGSFLSCQSSPGRHEPTDSLTTLHQPAPPISSPTNRCCSLSISLAALSLRIGHAQTGEPFAVAPDDAHKRLDRKDQRSHANALADAERTESLEREAEKQKEVFRQDPTLEAAIHGNEPSRGAKIDKSIIDDEEEELKKKEEAKKQSEEAHAHKKH